MIPRQLSHPLDLKSLENTKRSTSLSNYSGKDFQRHSLAGLDTACRAPGAAAPRRPQDGLPSPGARRVSGLGMLLWALPTLVLPAWRARRSPAPGGAGFSLAAGSNAMAYPNAVTLGWHQSPAVGLPAARPSGMGCCQLPGDTQSPAVNLTDSICSPVRGEKLRGGVSFKALESSFPTPRAPGGPQPAEPFARHPRPPRAW